jgi:hypothetical protein
MGSVKPLLFAISLAFLKRAFVAVLTGLSLNHTRKSETRSFQIQQILAIWQRESLQVKRKAFK